mmetsp:Transcript_53482/g.121942  ORF Transcript_53482/g.121942 Transcript_53482/m.121942 type:complete len:298 (+) Transcript_53482:160-1053(+)|eukprot:CAMPEP_0172595184 /NCGR_PEP_ID=MMETSP1068-20121228/14768_1 /TAXON_ID=35684 /ORGANISM="Pseudopedinella elastica, Strain CCMP716" /LENGTH=297 /DNA_ID=CAMNT_0013393619 /DNA_START=136 /DNA_END=1029 /DNA_ORIENTATION=-
MVLGSVLSVLGWLVFVWYFGVFAFAFQQELKVGWKDFGLKGRMAIFILAMEIAGTFHQVLVYVYSLVNGTRAGRQFGHRTMCRFFGWLTPILFGPFQVEGLENLPPKDEMCVYVSNHQSTVDFSLYYALPHDHFIGLCAVAKASIMYMPGFGAMTALCGGIMIKRGKKGTMQQLLEHSEQRLNDGINVGMFPQGTRLVPKPGVKPLEFKKGFAVMAAKTKKRVVPMTFLYASDFASGSRDLSKSAFKVIVHPAVTIQDSDAAIEAATKQVEATVLKPILDAVKAEEQAGNQEPKKNK